MKRLSGFLAVVAAVGVGGAAYLLLVHSGGHAAIAGGPAPVRPLQDAPDLLFSAPGVTEPQSKTVSIVSELGGTIRAVHVRAGDPVKKGQVLAELHDSIQKAGVDLARATLARAEAELLRLRNGERPEERAIIKSKLDEAEASLRLAEFEWQRAQKMVQQDAISTKEIESARIGLALAQARRDGARKQWELSEAGPRAEDVARAVAAVDEARASLDAAVALLEKTRIRSPLDGIVIYRYREPGEAVFTDVPSPILSVGDRSRLRVRVDVDELDVTQVRVGQRICATAPAYGDKRFAGRVLHIEPTLGRKNFRTNSPTEKVDMKVQEVVVELDDADEVPVELPMVVWFFDQPRRPATELSR